jgi:tight adherence protein B
VLGIIVLCVFGAVFLFAMAILSVISHVLEQYEERYLSRGATDLGEMFYFINPRQLLILTLAVSAIFLLLGFLVFNWFVAVLLGLVGFLVPFSGIKKLRARRILKFEEQLVDALTQMSAAFRAGLTLAQAAESIAQEMPPPLSQEFGLFVKEIKYGVHQDQALQNLASRVSSNDLQLMVTATIVAKQLGGNMAEIFDIISSTVRDRFRLEGRIRSLTAQGKMQGWVVGFMPLILGVVLNMMRPDLMEPMLHSPFGYMLITTVILMEMMGIFLIRKIVAIDV